jgi:hypothetical protein
VRASGSSDISSHWTSAFSSSPSAFCCCASAKASRVASTATSISAIQGDSTLQAEHRRKSEAFSEPSSQRERLLQLSLRSVEVFREHEPSSSSNSSKRTGRGSAFIARAILLHELPPWPLRDAKFR